MSHRTIVIAIAVIAVCAIAAASASAVVVRTGSGYKIGVMPKAGSTVHPASRHASASDGILSLSSGPVLHATKPYIVEWDPSSGVSSSETNIISGFFTDVAADTSSGNQFGGLRQYYDGTGFAGQSSSYAAGSQILHDTDTYPTNSNSNCQKPSGITACVTDAQIQTELANFIAAQGLSDGNTGTAPMYFVVLPGTTNVCYPDGNSPGTDCATGGSAGSDFCAYHDNDGDTTNGAIYAAIPLLNAEGPSAKSCQDDDTTPVQGPNGAGDTEVAVDFINHEYAEAVTDPVPGAGWTAASGNEVADECAFQDTTVDPNNDLSPTAYEPELGGDPTAGTAYNELINTHQYYLQSLWSNGGTYCEHKPAAGTITPAITVSSTSGHTVHLSPGSSTSTLDYSSATWTWGDGTAQTFNSDVSSLDNVSHTYASFGTYTATLTLVDSQGNTASTSQVVTVGSAPSASFKSSEATVGNFTFTATGSDPNSGGSITSYAWSFGDGTTGSGSTVAHQYSSPGSYTVTLTVTDNFGLTSSHSAAVTRYKFPAVTIGAPTTAVALGTPVKLTGAATDPNPGGTIQSYTWSFGDGTGGTGANQAHTFAAAGTYVVKLSATDSFNYTETVSHQVTVAVAPIAKLAVNTRHPANGAPVAFAGSQTASTTPVGSYAWSFGDGGTASVANPSHTYSKVGTYNVTLTVVDTNGLSSATTAVIHVAKAEHITSAKISVARSKVKVNVKVDGPGVVAIGSSRKTLKKAGTVARTLKLSSAQLRTLHRQHSLRYAVRVTFTPQAGSVLHRTLTLHIKG